MSDCGYRLIHHRLERASGHEFQLKPREDYALVKAILTLGVGKTRVSYVIDEAQDSEPPAISDLVMDEVY